VSEEEGPRGAPGAADEGGPALGLGLPEEFVLVFGGQQFGQVLHGKVLSAVSVIENGDDRRAACPISGRGCP
jgi:hypothetical protein